MGLKKTVHGFVQAGGTAFVRLRVALVVGAFALAAAAFAFAEQGWADSAPVQDSLARLRGDRAAVALLGKPIQSGPLILASFVDGETEEQATLTIPVRGSKGSGRLTVHGRRSRQGWHYEHITLRVRDREVDLPTR
jgi:hypothetical protein